MASCNSILFTMIVQLATIQAVLVDFSHSKELPHGFETCNQNDPNADKCINDAIEKSLSILRFGISSLNVPSLEPMKINNVNGGQPGATSPFNLKSTFRNAEIHGLSFSKMLRTSVKFPKFLMKSDAFTDRLDFIGQYTMNGQILVLPIRGEGFANVSMHELTTRHELTGDYFVGSDGNKYLNITDYKIKFKPKWVTFRFDNLFNGDKVLGYTMNKFMNDNWESVFDGIIPGYELNFGQKFRKVANALFHQVPFDVIFPEK